MRSPFGVSVTRECLVVHYDMSVRDSQGNLIQMIYGNDGRDGESIVKTNLKLHTHSLENFNHIFGRNSKFHFFRILENVGGGEANP